MTPAADPTRQGEFDFLIAPIMGRQRQLATAREAATIFQVNPQTVYNLVEAGKLESFADPDMVFPPVRITRRSIEARLVRMCGLPKDEFVELLLGAAKTLTQRQRSEFLRRLSALN